jgi:hypothetical protein
MTVDIVVATEASEHGILVGKSVPCPETKWTWWEVYRHKDKLVACAMSEQGVGCGIVIEEGELPKYVD